MNHQQTLFNSIVIPPLSHTNITASKCIEYTFWICTQKYNSLNIIILYWAYVNTLETKSRTILYCLNTLIFRLFWILYPNVLWILFLLYQEFIYSESAALISLNSCYVWPWVYIKDILISIQVFSSSWNQKFSLL